MILGDLPTLKALLEIPDCVTTEDRRLLIYLKWATEWIEELCDRPFAYKQRTQYLDGRGTSKLLLKARPVYPTGMQVYVDTASHYGEGDDPFPAASLLTYGTDYVLQIDDEENERSKCGIVHRLNAVWPRRWMRAENYLSPFQVATKGTIKVTYYGGYTVDQMPANVRGAVITLIAKMRNYFPIGMEIGGEGYEDRSLSYTVSDRNYLLTTVKDMLINHRNWTF